MDVPESITLIYSLFRPTYLLEYLLPLGVTDMPAPDAENAWGRVVQILAVPSVVVLLAVAITQTLYGSIAAGLILNVTTLLILVGIAVKTTYWNTEYTAMIAVGGTFLFFIAPGVFSVLVHPALAALNQIFFLGFLGYVWAVLLGKLGFDGSLL